MRIAITRYLPTIKSYSDGIAQAENQEYHQTINQTNEKCEEALGELAVTREHLHNAQVCEYQFLLQNPWTKNIGNVLSKKKYKG